MSPTHSLTLLAVELLKIGWRLDISVTTWRWHTRGVLRRRYGISDIGLMRWHDRIITSSFFFPSSFGGSFSRS